MLNLRLFGLVALLTSAGLLAAACDLGSSPRRRGRAAAPAPAAVEPAAAPAPAPAPTAAAAPAEAPAEAAAQPEEEPKDYKPGEALSGNVAAAEEVKPATPAQAAEKPAEVPAAATKETFADSEPPDPVYEEKPKAPSAAHVWTPGYWGWAGARWAWHPGVWRVRPAGLNYVPPHYEVHEGRVIYVGPYWGPRVVTRYYGGRVLAVRYPTVRPVWYRPGVRYYHRPVVGYRIGSRPVAIYRTYPAARVTARIVVPPRPVRVVRPAIGVRPVVGVRPVGGPAVRVGGPAVRVGGPAVRVGGPMARPMARPMAPSRPMPARGGGRRP
jgi:hypothetical protein